MMNDTNMITTISKPAILNPIRQIDINLNQLFPVSKLSVIRRSGKAALNFVFFTVIISILAWIMWDPLKTTQEFSLGILTLLFGTALLLLVVKLIYELLYSASFQYGFTRNHFYLTHGVFFKDKGSFPLSRITDVYLKRNFFDYLLGLSTIILATPNIKSVEFAKLRYLKKQAAEQLKQLLVSVLNNGVDSLVDDPLFKMLANKNGLTSGELKVILMEHELKQSITTEDLEPDYNRIKINNNYHYAV